MLYHNVLATLGERYVWWELHQAGRNYRHCGKAGIRYQEHRVHATWLQQSPAQGLL